MILTLSATSAKRLNHMDAITNEALETLAKEHPSYSIRLSHQFNDGSNNHECGFVPNDWNGQTLYFEKRAD